MTTHELKTWPEPFTAILARRKRHEVRVDDRGFLVGDTLRLKEWNPAPPGPVAGRYTGREVDVRVTYISVVTARPGKPKTVVMSIRRAQVERKPEAGPPPPGSFNALLQVPEVAKVVQESVTNGVVRSTIFADQILNGVPRGTPEANDATPSAASEADTVPSADAAARVLSERDDARRLARCYRKERDDARAKVQMAEDQRDHFRAYLGTVGCVVPGVAGAPDEDRMCPRCGIPFFGWRWPRRMFGRESARDQTNARCGACDSVSPWEAWQPIRQVA